MAKFRCKQSGTVLEFTQEHDIEQLRQQEDYEEVVEEEQKKPPVKRTRKSKDEE